MRMRIFLLLGELASSSVGSVYRGVVANALDAMWRNGVLRKIFFEATREGIGESISQLSKGDAARAITAYRV